ncbi:MAG: glycine--tRNA ligase subunit beta [Acidobacteriota bacterium]
MPAQRPQPSVTELLVEIRCQEMGPRLARRLVRRVGGRVFEELMSRGIAMSELVTATTPRRLAFSVRGLPETDVESERVVWGPAVAAAEDAAGQAALLAFAEEQKIEASSLERRATESGERYARVEVIEGRPIAAVMVDLLERILSEVPSYFELAGGRLWPRPVTGLCAVLGGEPLPLSWAGHRASGETVGHPILSPEPVAVSGWRDYEAGLADRRIAVTRGERLERLERSAVTLAGGHSAQPAWGAGRRALLDRWAGSCEIPGVIEGRIAPEALGLPRELWVTVLAERQGAVAIEREGELLPLFLAVMDRDDDSEGHVRSGRERAVAGDLLDALLDYERDRAVPMAQRVRQLEQITFHERLGTYADKSRRLGELADLACRDLGWDDVREQALEAAKLAKADLTTRGVEAFSSLEGVMGGLLAREEGYAEPVWQAIYDHARPLGEGAPIPRGRVGRVLAVADRLGSLVGFFGLSDDEPDGRRRFADPHALGLRAHGLLRLILEGEMEALDLDLLIARAVLLYGDLLERDAESILRRLQAFLDRRLDHLLGGRGFRADEIEAAKAVGTRNLPDLLARLEGLRAWRGEAAFAELLATSRRMAKIGDEAPEATLEPALLTAPAERELLEHLERVSAEVDERAAGSDYGAALGALMTLVPPLESFFAQVLILDQDERLRASRVALIQACRRQCWRVARLGALRASGLD